VLDQSHEPGIDGRAFSLAGVSPRDQPTREEINIIRLAWEDLAA
jgi:hypothetical protein